MHVGDTGLKVWKCSPNRCSERQRRAWVGGGVQQAVGDLLGLERLKDLARADVTSLSRSPRQPPHEVKGSESLEILLLAGTSISPPPSGVQFGSDRCPSQPPP
jgi:hypothetical protein